MIKYLRLDQQFDAARMQADMARLEATRWHDHYNRTGYEGSWTTLQLRSLRGELGNNVVSHAGAAQQANDFQDTPLLAQCPYLREVIDFFEIEKTAVRLMKLDAGASIKPHRDDDLNFEQGEVRLHVPVSTNPQVQFRLDGEQLPMPAGSCWYLNLALPHSVRNDGDTPRVHLVIDGLVNDWLRDYFGQPRHHRVLLPDAPATTRHRPQDTRHIIAELRRQQTPSADQLADQLEASLP